MRAVGAFDRQPRGRQVRGWPSPPSGGGERPLDGSGTPLRVGQKASTIAVPASGSAIRSAAGHRRTAVAWFRHQEQQEAGGDQEAQQRHDQRQHLRATRPARRRVP